MKKAVAFSALLFSLLLVSCGGDSSPTSTTSTPVATSITLSVTSLSLASLGVTSQLSATVKDQNGATVSGATVAAGDRLGTHYGTESNSDIAGGIVTPDGYMLVSYFDVMTDDVFRDHEARGASSRSDSVITAAERDADPLMCEGEEFSISGTLPQWFDLNVTSSSSRPQ